MIQAIAAAVNPSVKNYALVGFANSGKSSVFNLFAGNQHKVANWTGVTVDIKHKEIKLSQPPTPTAILYDLPGINSLISHDTQGQDLTISQQFLQHQQVDCIVNVIDATQINRQLYLTSQLLELKIPMVVLLNKSDRAEALAINVEQLSLELGCPVIEVSAHNKNAINDINQLLLSSVNANQAITVNTELLTKKASIADIQNRHVLVAKIFKKVSQSQPNSEKFSDKIDRVVLNPILGLPIFFAMMYLLFMFAINVGGAFIDFFDIVSGALFVSYPLQLLAPLNLPQWLLVIIEGLGSGVQTVATFIPIIASLFIGLSILENSGYLARAAFVVDVVMQKIGLPGKAFVPLIVGFGCTVPAVMSARVLDSERERITTIMMAPFMSCGARLPVYALFAAAFFPDNGQNLVFLLYLVGIGAAIFTGFLLKKTILQGNSSVTIMELPLYEIPKISYISAHVWRRTKGFITGAGKTIIIVVCLLNFFNSIDRNGQFGHQNSEQSILSQSAKVVIPLLAPMGVKPENWQAAVGIITGIFAKEVLVATFNNLYSPQADDTAAELSWSDTWHSAITSIKINLLGIQADDPLSMSVGNITDLKTAAQEQDVAISTYHNMQTAFNGQLSAFSYLLFILLYTPCIAAMGAIKNELNNRWAAFAGIWSFVLAYLSATLCYQLGNIFNDPWFSLPCIAGAMGVLIVIYYLLKHQGRKIMTIPIAVNYY